MVAETKKDELATNELWF